MAAKSCIKKVFQQLMKRDDSQICNLFEGKVKQIFNKLEHIKELEVTPCIGALKNGLMMAQITKLEITKIKAGLGGYRSIIPFYLLNLRCQFDICLFKAVANELSAQRKDQLEREIWESCAHILAARRVL